jgi:hypothetical protein
MLGVFMLNVAMLSIMVPFYRVEVDGNDKRASLVKSFIGKRICTRLLRSFKVWACGNF